MVAKGKRGKTRTVARKKGGFKRRKTNLRKQILTLQELKYLSNPAWFATNSAATWTINNLPFYSIAQGNANGQRIGNKIYCESIDFTIRVQSIAATMGNIGSTCRVIIWHQIRANGAAPAVTDIFETDVYNGQKTLAYFPKRVTVVYDKMHVMVPTTGTTSGPIFDTIFKLKISKWINFTGVAGNIADISNHNYGMAFCADGANCCTVKAGYRIRYRDG